MNLKRLYQKSFFLPVIIAFTYFCLLLDTVKYPGFVGKHFLIDAKAYLAICIVLMLVFKTKNRFIKFISKINLLILAVSGFGYIYFSIAEAVHYPNYVLARFHFSLEGFIYIVIFSAAIFIIGKLGDLEVIKKKKGNLGNMIIYFLIAYTLIVGMGVTLKNSIVGDIYIALHLRDSYDQKMYNQWGNFYEYMLFVRDNVPEDANMVIPPQLAPWWTRTGNMELVRYFVYPRKIIQYNTEEIPNLDTLPPDTYIMVAWGEWGCDIVGCKGWPEQTIKVKEAIYKDPNSTGVKEIRENFTYDPKDTKNSFGLLKI